MSARLHQRQPLLQGAGIVTDVLEDLEGAHQVELPTGRNARVVSVQHRSADRADPCVGRGETVVVGFDGRIDGGSGQSHSHGTHSAADLQDGRRCHLSCEPSDDIPPQRRSWGERCIGPPAGDGHQLRSVGRCHG